MRRLPADVLDDPAYRMPAVPAGASGVAWLRTHVPRFCDGDRHAHLRPLSVALIESLADAPFVDDPALVDRLRSGSTAPPVPTTRRRAPDDTPVEVDLAAAPFGSGPHRCPGEALARRLAAAALER